MKNVIQAKAKEKQQGGQGGILLSQKSDEANGMRTDEELSKLAGVSRRPSVSCCPILGYRVSLFPVPVGAVQPRSLGLT